MQVHCTKPDSVSEAKKTQASTKALQSQFHDRQHGTYHIYVLFQVFVPSQIKLINTNCSELCEVLYEYMDRIERISHVMK